MLEATEEIKEVLKERAHEISKPFCYSDYRTVEPGEDGQARCPLCGSDDLMRELPGVGVEWGYEWIMEHLVREEGEAIDIEELYSDLLDEVYQPIKFGELEYCPSQVLKSVDPIAFDMGANEYADGLVEDGDVVCLGGRFYRM